MDKEKFSLSCLPTLLASFAYVEEGIKDSWELFGDIDCLLR